MTEREPTAPTGTISRRRLLQGTALAGIGAFLAACRAAGTVASPTPAPSASPTEAPSGTEAPSASAVASGPLGGKLNFANWTAYIDLTVDPGPDGVEGTDDDGYVLPSPTLDQFTKATGIEVNYKEAVNDNEEFFGTDLQGPLSQGQPTAWDLIVMTDFMAARLIRLGWVETIDTTGMTNFPKNLEDQYLTRSFDPGAKMTAPWQSGTTGLGFDSKVTGNLDSLDAFWDSKYKGKVDYLSEMRDAVGLSALRLGSDPATSPTTSSTPPWPRSRSRSTRSSSGRSRATTTCPTSRRATSSCRCPGRATSSSSRRTRRRSSTRSPRKAACCGPTT
jgi:spermidine/putrescine transport system substrate-binding protein